MALKDYIHTKKAFVFELDDVLYPRKDYLLQVYYLFAQFMEYGEQMNAETVLKSMRETYLKEGPDTVFEKTAKVFGIPEKYTLNFDLLLSNARLPLKLLLFDEMLKLIQELVLERKQIFLFIDGPPEMQLNKIRQIEWHGLENYLEVHFAAESAAKPSAKGLQLIAEKHNLKKADILMVGRSETDRLCAKNTGIDFFNIDKLLLP